MQRSFMQGRQGAVLTALTAAHGMRRSRRKQQESKSPFIRQRNCVKSTGKRRKPSFTSTFWRTSEENFTTFGEILVLVRIWTRAATWPLRSWHRNYWTTERQVLFFRVFDITGGLAFGVFGPLWCISVGREVK